MFKKIPWGPTFLFILGFPLLLSLGFWQLQRLHQKEAYLYWRHSQSILPIVEFTTLKPYINCPEHEFQRVSLKGQVLPEIFIIPNRPHPSGKGFSGQYVLSPFLIENTKHVVLINWGWIPRNKQISPPYHIKTLEALIRLPEKPNYFTPKNTSSHTYSIIPADFLENRFPAFYMVHTNFYLQRVMPPQENQFFPRTLPIEPVLANRHLEYAVTWFSFAFTFAIIYGIYLRRYRKAN